jgi:cell division protein YceG involved in septum cleavage
MKYIYVYTSPAYLHKNWYKIGETITNPEKRVKSQDNSSNPEPLIFVHAWMVPSNTTDKKVHKRLEQDGFTKIRKEWFELSDDPKEDVKQAILKITTLIQDIEQNNQTFLSTIQVPNYTEMWWFQNK